MAALNIHYTSSNCSFQVEQRGISGRIEGEYLQGGIGELEAMDFVRVLVADEDYAEVM
jgi:hypothetical protein